MDIGVNKKVLSLDNGYSCFNTDRTKVFGVSKSVDVHLKKDFKEKMIYIVLASLMNEDRIVETGYNQLSNNVALYTANMLQIPTETIKRHLIDLEKMGMIKCIYKSKHRGEKSIYKIN